ncbi:hypothetical protein [Streptomyces virginiae]
MPVVRGRFALHDLDGVPAGPEGLLRRGRIDGDAVIPSSLLKESQPASA